VKDVIAMETRHLSWQGGGKAERFIKTLLPEWA
jgi:hypothetical protein